jgi:TonB family protein
MLGAFVLFLAAWFAVRSFKPSNSDVTVEPHTVAAAPADSSVAEPQEEVVAQSAPDVPQPSADLAMSAQQSASPAGNSSARATASSPAFNPTARSTAKASAAVPSSARASTPSIAPMPDDLNDDSPNATPDGVMHKEIPDVPARAQRSIRGKVRVAVRVIVNNDGTVFATLTDQRGPSRYFERIALDAAKKWTFVAAESDKQRLVLIRFAFSREGTTAESVPVR